jgi:hypothetical protein
LASAEQALAESADILARESMSAEAFRVGTSFQRAAEAYLHYRKEEISRAITCVMEALSLDEELIEQAGYAILALHRVQLVHNLMRIEAVTGSPIRASELGFALLEYLERRNIDNLPGCWRPADLDAIPVLLVERMFVQIVSELAALLARARDTHAASLSQHLSDHVNAMDDYCRVSAVSHLWMQEKLSLLSGEPQLCLARMPELLTSSRATAPTIWSCAVFDLAAVCRATGSHLARHVHTVIVADSRTWYWLPQIWRAIWASV